MPPSCFSGRYKILIVVALISIVAIRKLGYISVFSLPAGELFECHDVVLIST